MSPRSPMTLSSSFTATGPHAGFAHFDGAIALLRRAIACQHRLQFRVDVFVRVGSLGGRCSFRPFHSGMSNSGRTSISNSNGQRTFFRQLDRLEVEIGLADRRELMFFADLCHAVHQQRTLDLLGDLVFESDFDQLSGCSTRAKARDFRLGLQLVERILRSSDRCLPGAPTTVTCRWQALGLSTLTSSDSFGFSSPVTSTGSPESVSVELMKMRRFVHRTELAGKLAKK